MTSAAVETVRVGEGGRIVVARGELDYYAAPALRADLLAAVATGDVVVVDLLEVTFIDSTALGTLVGAAKRLREGRRLALACRDDNVRRTLELTGIDRVVPVFETVEAAFAGGGPVHGA
jgi:anti-sigma B factor antagonist